MKQKDLLEEKKLQLLQLTAEFCDEKLDEEHKDLTRKLIHQLYRKDAIHSGNTTIEELAAGVIHAIGSVNLLFDDSFEPYISEDELNEYFDVKPEITVQHSIFFKEQLNLTVFDSDFFHLYEQERSPLKNTVSIDGIFIPLDLLPKYLKEKVEEVRADGYQIEFRSDEV